MQISNRDRKFLVKFAHGYATECHECKIFNKRKYRQKPGYASYRDACLQIGYQVHTIPEAKQTGRLRDITWYGTTYSYWKALTDNNFGVYAIAPELWEAFKQSSPPTQLWALKKLFDRALIFFPENSIITPDGNALNWVLVEFLAPNFEKEGAKAYLDYLHERIGIKKLETPDYEGVNQHRIKWSATLDYEFVYQSVTALPDPDSTEVYTPKKLFYTGDPEQEQDFIDWVSGMIFQILLYMCGNQEDVLIEQKGFATIGTNKKHKKGKNASQARNFITVGSNYKPIKVNRGGTHTSPKEHARRGFYRTLSWRPEGEQEVWVRPTIVNRK